MKLGTFGLVLLVGVGCQESTAPERCTRPDVENGCTAADRVTRTGNPWTVSVYSTTSRVEAYDDGGFVCNLTVRSCSQKVCFVSVGDTRTDAQMIASCRG